MFWVLICSVHLTVCSCHVSYSFSELIHTLELPQELLARSSCKIWRWNDCNWTRTQNHLVLKRALNHLDKRTKWLSVVLSTYLYGAFDCMFSSCHVRIFRVNPNSLVAWLSRNSLVEAGAESEGKVTATGLEPRTTSFLNEHSTIWANCPNDWAVFWLFISKVHLTVRSCHVTYALSEWTHTL